MSERNATAAAPSIAAQRDAAPVLLRGARIAKRYQMGPSSLRVLEQCDLDVREGEFVAIMGKSGSGKSTLLHLLGALDVPDEGEVLFGGESVSRPISASAGWAARIDGFIRRGKFASTLVHTVLLAAVAGLCGGLGALLFSLFGGPATARVLMLIGSLCAGVAAMALLRPTLHQQLERTRVAYRRRRFGFVFQFYHLLPELSVLENVVLPRQVACGFFGWSRERVAAEADARRVLERVGLTERLNHKPAELSGGERQRVAIARALVHHPRVLLADEPTGNLDAEAGANIMRILCGLRGEGQTIVMVTHDPTIAANADRVLVLERGRLRPT